MKENHIHINRGTIVNNGGVGEGSGEAARRDGEAQRRARIKIIGSEVIREE